MSVYSIWDSRFPAEDADEGIAVTREIWRDMRSFDGTSPTSSSTTSTSRAT